MKEKATRANRITGGDLPSTRHIWSEETCMAENRELPGWLKKRLVGEVRSHLWNFGTRPKGERWRATLSWAYAVAQSYSPPRRPLPTEIASQYVLLMRAEMRDYFSLKLPYRADKVIPDHVRRLLPESRMRS